MSAEKIKITVQVIVNAPIENVWNIWNAPEHIVKWNSASDEWHTPKAENDLRVGGKLFSRMESKDGKMGFDFIGIFTLVKNNEQIDYVLEDERKVSIQFISSGNATQVIETFEAESENSIELQKFGWQAIMDNFKKYAESI